MSMRYCQSHPNLIKIEMMALILFFLTNFLSSNESEIYIKTDDRCEISSTINVSSRSKIILLEVHGLGSNKNEWSFFNKHLKDRNIGYISIDLRGHGKSTICNGKTIKYPHLSQYDVEGFTKDISATYKYLKLKYPNMTIIPIGASIGANAIMKYFHKERIKIVLISPGVKYATYEIADLFNLTDARILIVTSENDVYSFNSTKIFLKTMLLRKITYSIIVAKNGHGVEIFNSMGGSEYIERILNWILD